MRYSWFLERLMIFNTCFGWMEIIMSVLGVVITGAVGDEEKGEGVYKI